MKIINMFFSIFLCPLFLAEQANNINSEFNAMSVGDCVDIIKCTDQWKLDFERYSISQNDPVYLAVELIGFLRLSDFSDDLADRIQWPTSIFNHTPDGSNKYFVAKALSNIGNNALTRVLINCSKNKEFSGSVTYFSSIYPDESVISLIDDYLRHNAVTMLKEDIDNLYLLKSIFSQKSTPFFSLKSECIQYKRAEINAHPLYKARQSAIEMNIVILKAQKKWSVLDTNTLAAVDKLGEVRAVEAVEVLVPKLLLKPDSTVKPSERKIDEKYVSIKDYPVAVALAEIGIPSIWGLLDEIVTGNHDDNYREIAHKTMSAILPAVAIPGFVNEALKKHTGEISQLRLYKMYPLMGLPIEGTPLIPQFREWQSTDKLFKTTAKFVSLDKGDVTLEKSDGKRTTIELSALRKEDQDYVKEQTATAEKTVEKEKK